MAGADSIGLNRLAALGRQRAAETGRTSPSDADMDWLVKQAKPAEVTSWGTPKGFAVIEKSFAGANASGTKDKEGTMAKKKPGIGARVKSALGIGKKKAAPRRAAGGSSAPKSGSRGKKKGIIARAGGAIKSTFGFGKKAPMFAKRKSFPGLPPAQKKTLAVSVPTASGNLGLFEAKLNPQTGVYEMEKPEGGHHAVQPHARGKGGGMSFGGSKGGSMVPTLTLGLSVLGGGALGMYLQTLPTMTLPVVGWKVRKGVVAFFVALAAAVALRNKAPRIARHFAGLTAGIAAGMGAERVAVKRGLVKEST
jgi:hypothetical protein